MKRLPDSSRVFKKKKKTIWKKLKNTKILENASSIPVILFFFIPFVFIYFLKIVRVKKMKQKIKNERKDNRGNLFLQATREWGDEKEQEIKN